MAIDQQFVWSLVRGVQRAGPIGSGNQPYVQLQANEAALLAKISATDGRQVVSVSAGEGASWQVSGSLQDLYGAYSLALDWVEGRTPLVKRTTSVFPY